MPWIIGGAIAGSALIGGASSYFGGQAAAKGADTAAKVSNDQYLQSRQDYAPWRNAGAAAIYNIQDLLGLGGTPTGQYNAFLNQQPLTGSLYANQSSRGQTPLQDIRAAQAQGKTITDAQWAQAGLPPGGVVNYGQGATTNGAPSDWQTAQQNAFAKFRADPGYQFAFDEGQRALQSSAAARGILNSGATAKALTRYGQGVADQQYGNYFNRLASLAGIGQNATNSIAQIGQNSANTQGNAFMNAGNARASAYGGIGQSLNQGIQNYLLYDAFKNPGGYATYANGNWTPGPEGFPI
jgi:hypothetical protein